MPMRSNHHSPGPRLHRSLAVLGALLLGATSATAAPAPAEPAPAAEPAAAAPPAPVEPNEPAAPEPPPATGKLTQDPLADALRPVPGGLRPSDVAKRAARTSHTVAAKEAELRAAAAKVDQALVGFVPILSTSFGYTRLSEVENKLDFGVSIPGMSSAGFEFPVILDNWSLQAQVAVPFSDYLLRLTHGYAAASEGAEAKRLEARAEALKGGSDAKVAYYNWLRAKGNRVVAELAVAQTEEHVKDARVTLEAQLLSRADLLRLESQLAQTGQLAVQMKNFEAVAERLLRTAVHMKEQEQLTIGVDLMATPAPGPLEGRSREQIERLAIAQRLELRAIDATDRSLESLEALTAAGYFPRLDGFFSLNYANPNSRIFPSKEEWAATWMLGLQASWTINDTFSTIGKARETAATRAALTEQRQALEDGIRMSVTAAYYEAQTARSAITAAERSEEAATEGLRVRRDLFMAGRATSTDLVDAETELTRARLQRVNAHVDLLVAQAKLAYAVGVEEAS